MLEEYAAVYAEETDEDGNVRFSETDEFANCNYYIFYHSHENEISSMYYINVQTQKEYLVCFVEGEMQGWIEQHEPLCG